MRLSIFDSDKSFIKSVLLIGFSTAIFIYVVFDHYANTFAMQKDSEQYDHFISLGNEIDAVVLGTSHATVFEARGKLHLVRLAAAHTIPTVMYIKAKLIIKTHPETKVVYLEADDHLFFNGRHYSLDGMTPDEKRRSKVFESAGVFIDQDGEREKIFGVVASAKSEPLMLLEDNIKPVLIKRIADYYMSLLFPLSRKAIGYAADKDAACDLSAYPKELSLDDSIWSLLPDLERQRRVSQRLDEHNLNKFLPIHPLMAEYYEKTVKVLRDNHIDVVLVLFPEASEYVSQKNPDTVRLHNEFVQSIANKYHLRILDLRDLSQYGNRIFNDTDHLDDRYGWVVAKRMSQDYCMHIIES